MALVPCITTLFSRITLKSSNTYPWFSVLKYNTNATAARMNPIVHSNDLLLVCLTMGLDVFCFCCFTFAMRQRSRLWLKNGKPGQRHFFSEVQSIKNSSIQPHFYYLEKYDFEYFSKKLPLENLQVLATKSLVVAS